MNDPVTLDDVSLSIDPSILIRNLDIQNIISLGALIFIKTNQKYSLRKTIDGRIWLCGQDADMLIRSHKTVGDIWRLIS